jgi:exosome complex exonuclease RRP6
MRTATPRPHQQPASTSPPFSPRFKPTQHVNDFPEGDDLKMHRTMDRKLAKRLDATTARVLALASKLVDHVAPQAGTSVDGRHGEAAPAFASVGIKKRKRLQDEDDAVHEFESQIVEVLDSLLERADINLDTVTGKRKATEISEQAEAAFAVRQKALDSKRGTKETGVQALPEHIINADIPKPQVKFDPPVNNDNDLPPWTPTLPVKHHAMVPLDYIPTPSNSRPASPEAEATTGAGPTLAPTGIAEVRGVTVRHPYIYETKHLGYPSSLFTTTPAIAPKSFADTPFTWVDTPQQLDSMVEKLKLAQELAVDLEYHSTRSFTGFLCLMQISTRDEDFVVDVIRLRKEVREGKLGGVLADPSIVKVRLAVLVRHVLTDATFCLVGVPRSGK